MSFSDNFTLDYLKSTAERFSDRESLGGILLILSSIVAFLWVNLDIGSGSYEDWMMSKFVLGFEESFQIELSVRGWINDGLMAIFFLVVGMEVKREVLAGQLSTIKKASLPILAAVGGMLVPALIYVIFNYNAPYDHAWGIPMATDIAYSLGILGLLGVKGNTPMKITLTALAVADDLGAIAIIAIFYSGHLAWMQLGLALGILLILILMNFWGEKRLAPYIVLGFIFWLCFIHSGIHPTVAGVILAFVIPMKPRLKPHLLVRFIDRQLKNMRKTKLKKKGPIKSELQEKSLLNMQAAANYTLPPLLRMEKALTDFNAFIIIPLFALANAGVKMDGESLSLLMEPLGLGILLGLFLGKPLGILLFSGLGLRLGWATMPKNMNLLDLAVIGTLAGIGFTMSLFITNLAIHDPQGIAASKLSIFIATVFSITLSVILFRISKWRKQKKEEEA